MRASLVPIPDFLAGIIQAADTCTYAGVLVVIARQGGGGAPMLAELARLRASLHDVTGEDILVVVPATEQPRQKPAELAAFIPDPSKKWDLYSAPGLLVDGGSRSAWRQAVWAKLGEPERRPNTIDHSRVQLPKEIDWTVALTNVDMRSSTVAEDLELEVTLSASTTAKALGLDETHVPCIVVLALHERRLNVLPAESLEIYDFLTDVIRRRPAETVGPWLSEAVGDAGAAWGLVRSAFAPPRDPIAALQGWEYVAWAAPAPDRASPPRRW